MEAGQVPGEEGTHALLCSEAKGNSSSSRRTAAPGHYGSLGARFLVFHKAQKLQNKTSKNPDGSNVGTVSYQRGLPVSWLCKRSCRVEEGA